MSTIVCATDLSPESNPVVAVAAAMSRLLSWPLELLHVVRIPPLLPPDLVSEEVVKAATDIAQEKLEAQAGPLRDGGLEVMTALEISLNNDLRLSSRKSGGGLLVLGTHARNRATRFFLGSVAERTISEAAGPVLVVPPHAGGRLITGAVSGAPLKLLLGIDLSPGSDAALTWLRDLRRAIDCDARLLHLFSPEREHARLGLEPPQPFEADHEVVEVLSRELRAHVEKYLDSDLPLRIRPSWGGEEDPIAWEAETDGADLLVIGASQTRRSTALATVRGSRLPVLCVPKRGEAAPAPHAGPLRTVLVPTDFSPAGNAAVAEACQLLAASGGDVILAHVAKPQGLGLDPDRQYELETCLLGLMPETGTVSIRSRTFVTVDDAPGEAIVKAVRRFDPDAVVMSSQGHHDKGPGRHGPITEYVVWNSPKPVMIVPAPVRRD